MGHILHGSACTTACGASSDPPESREPDHSRQPYDGRQAVPVCGDRPHEQVRLRPTCAPREQGTASAFLVTLIAAVPYKIHTVLTDNGIQFTFPPRDTDRPTATYITHRFDMRCQEHGIEHRLTKIQYPWTNGQVERMNRTIKDATVNRSHDESHRQLAAHLHDFINASNYGRRLKTLKGLTPFEYIGKIWTQEPERFTSNPTHQMLGLGSGLIL